MGGGGKNNGVKRGRFFVDKIILWVFIYLLTFKIIIMPLSSTPGSNPPLFKFKSGDFPALMAFMAERIRANAVPLKEDDGTCRFPKPPARILKLAQSLHDNEAIGTVQVKCHKGDFPALNAWDARVAEILDNDYLINFQLGVSVNPQTEFDSARAFILRLDHKLQDMIKELQRETEREFVSDVFHCDFALLNVREVFEEIRRYVCSRCRAIDYEGSIWSIKGDGVRIQIKRFGG